MYAGIGQASHRSASRYWMTTTVTASQSMSGRDKFDESKQMSGDFISPLWIFRLVQAGRFDQIFTPTSDFEGSIQYHPFTSLPIIHWLVLCKHGADLHQQTARDCQTLADDTAAAAENFESPDNRFGLVGGDFGGLRYHEEQ
ncbi:hypothetical protein RRG08_016368 [Elysia crispata]|uniref:Uncharacterized protein n=1 Tax=Elysia crispata TaxID=231223 RepID=A0AAE1AF33_9GAST|nr:hypothetical protein RRG08_016368 [Elysia crispata]